MKRYSSSKDTGAPCQRCMILRVFLGMVLFVVILGLAGGNELSYFKYITTQKVANAIMIIGFIIFIFKIIFWYWDKKRENVSEILKKLDQSDRKILRSMGIKFGRYHIFLYKWNS